MFLSQWRPLTGLRELNLSANNFGSHDQVIVSMMGRMSHLTCFSVSYCSFNEEELQHIASQAQECSQLKVLCIQGYTPLPLDTTVTILDICARITLLQKVLLFPELYAFPGNNDWEREANKDHALGLGYHILASRNRPDVELE